MQTMKWKVNNEQFAESVITNYLKQKSFVGFVSMFHKNDVVAIKKVIFSDENGEIEGNPGKKAEGLVSDKKIEESPSKEEHPELKVN
jgi:hypothetical protein